MKKYDFNLFSFRLNSVRTQNVRIVPMSSSVGAWSLQKTLENNARRLEVLKNCVNFIFDNKISDARIVSSMYGIKPS